MKDLQSSLYGVCALAAFTLLALPTTALVALTPGLRARRSIAQRSARIALTVTGIALDLEDAGSLARQPCIVVANHSSYLDGIALTAALPPNFCFVIKREVTRVPIMHLLLRRLGSAFVERYNPRRGTVDTRRLLRIAGAGESLVFFPEGTFRRRRGLGPFHGGAFTIAARTRLPIVPVLIRGTREILPSGARLPRHGRIAVQVLPPIETAAGGSATELRDATRALMLEQLGEPDLRKSARTAGHADVTCSGDSVRQPHTRRE